MMQANRKSIITGWLLILLLLIPAASAQDEEAVRVKIPVLGIESPLAEFRLGRSTWRISPWASGIGHLEGTAWFGSAGNTVLAAHSQIAGRRPGIFADLHTLVPGDEVLVDLAGETHRYAVHSISNVALDEVDVVYPTSHAQLTLITCDAASFDPGSQLYQRRVVVIAYPA